MRLASDAKRPVKHSPNKFQDRKDTWADSASDNKHSMLRCQAAGEICARNFTRGNDRLRPIRIALRSVTSSAVSSDNRAKSAHGNELAINLRVIIPHCVDGNSPAFNVADRKVDDNKGDKFVRRKPRRKLRRYFSSLKHHHYGRLRYLVNVYGIQRI